MQHLPVSRRRIETPTIPPALMEGALRAVKITADVFTFLGVVPGELPVFPSGREVVELEGGDLVPHHVRAVVDHDVHVTEVTAQPPQEVPVRLISDVHLDLVLHE